MFKTGDVVVYGSSGVYRVVSVGGIAIKGCEGRQYYTMEPVFGSGTSYVPVDTEVFMRSIMTREEAERLIDSMPAIDVCSFGESSPRALKEHYSAAIQSHDSSEMIGLIKYIHNRRINAERSNKKPSHLDIQYMEQAEDLIFGELSAALDIPRETVPEYIRERLNNSK